VDQLPMPNATCTKPIINVAQNKQASFSKQKEKKTA